MASPQQAPQPIIIIKKKGRHGGHHGGAWKVAYADFVTAMMALFIVLWLLNSDQKVKEAVGGYFSDPTGSGKMAGTSQAGVGDSVTIRKDDMAELKKKLEKAMKEMPEFKSIKEHVTMTVTGEGLRVELLETDEGMFFQVGSHSPTQSGKETIIKLSQEVGKLPNHILIEGHTDAKPYAGGADYGNFELSVDRANAARRLMDGNGLRVGQVKQVRGFADQSLRNSKDPLDAANRRISLLIAYLDAKPSKPEAQEAAKYGEGAAHGEEKSRVKEAHGEAHLAEKKEHAEAPKSQH